MQLLRVHNLLDITKYSLHLEGKLVPMEEVTGPRLEPKSAWLHKLKAESTALETETPTQG